MILTFFTDIVWAYSWRTVFRASYAVFTVFTNIVSAYDRRTVLLACGRILSAFTDAVAAAGAWCAVSAVRTLFSRMAFLIANTLEAGITCWGHHTILGTVIAGLIRIADTVATRNALVVVLITTLPRAWVGARYAASIHALFCNGAEQPVITVGVVVARNLRAVHVVGTEPCADFIPVGCSIVEVAIVIIEDQEVNGDLRGDLGAGV